MKTAVQLLNEVARIEAEIAAAPHDEAHNAAAAKLAEARAGVAALEADRPEMAPTDLVAARSKAREAVEVAEIELRRAAPAVSHWNENLAEAINGLREEVVMFLLAAAEGCKERTRQRLEAVLGDDREIWTGEIGGSLVAACCVVARPLARHLGIVDGRQFAPVSLVEKLAQIRRGLETAVEFEKA